MSASTESQRRAAEDAYGAADESRYAFHDTTNPLIRFLRDRRLEIAIQALRIHTPFDGQTNSALVVCGGVGGEATFLANLGFSDVTNADIAQRALDLCVKRDSRLKTKRVDAEAMVGLEDDSYDLVLVQDGLHHLPRPSLGLTEMLRVARRAVIVIEPHYSLVGRLIGTEWEVHGDATNYVFRWNNAMFRQTVLSYIGHPGVTVIVRRLWDHNVAVRKLVEHTLPGPWRLFGARAFYAALSPLNRLGNMMVAVVIKPDR